MKRFKGLDLVDRLPKEQWTEVEKMAEEYDRETTFSPTNSPKDHLNAEQLPQNNFWMLAEDTRDPERHSGFKGGRTKYEWQKELGIETLAGGGVMKKFPKSRKPSHRWDFGEFWNLRGQHNQEKNTTQNMYLTTTASGEVVQMLTSATSKWGLDKEERAASSVLRVRTRPECPENNQRELTWDSNPNCGIAKDKKKKERKRELTH